MKIRSRRLFLSVLTGVLLAQAPGMALAEEPARSTADAVSDAAAIGVDVVLLRPLGFVRFVVGVVAMVPISVIDTIALPYHMDDGVYRENYERLIADPVDYVFKRPIGESLAGG